MPTPTRPDNETDIVLKEFLEFEENQFPPKPKGYAKATDPKKGLQIAQFATMFGEKQVITLRQRAEADKQLRKALGKRYAYLSASLADTKDKSQKQEIRLEYFNYTTNRAVHVWLSDDEVRQVRVQQCQPPESDDEIRIAEAIIRRNSRYKDAVEGLPVRGILTPSPKGHRYIYLMFKNEGEPAVFDATVDLTAGEIVEAGFIKHE